MVKKYIELNDLGEKSFVGKQTGGKVKIDLQISRRTNNGIQLLNDGLFMLNSTGLTDYDLTPVSYVTISTNGNAEAQRQRRLMSVFGRLGIVNMVFSTSRGSQRHTIFNIPANAPTPSRMISAQTFDGGLVWCEANARSIIANNLRANTTYSVQLVGFFN